MPGTLATIPYVRTRRGLPTGAQARGGNGSGVWPRSRPQEQRGEHVEGKQAVSDGSPPRKAGWAPGRVRGRSSLNFERMEPLAQHSEEQLREQAAVSPPSLQGTCVQVFDQQTSMCSHQGLYRQL